MTALSVAAEICREFESFEAHPYLCPAKVPTIGYGTTRYPDGRKVTLADPAISIEEGEKLLQHGLLVLERRVLELCPGLEGPRLGAVVSWTYNLGLGNLRRSTMRRRINARLWPAASVEMKRWVYAGGVKLRGLERRRALEASILLRGHAL